MLAHSLLFTRWPPASASAEPISDAECAGALLGGNKPGRLAKGGQDGGDYGQLRIAQFGEDDVGRPSEVGRSMG